MKKAINLILTTILTITIAALIISFNIESVMINTLADSVIKNEITNNINYINEKYNTNNNQLFKDISNSITDEETTKIISQKYIDSIISTIQNKEKIKPNLTDEIKTIIEKNENLLAEYNITITEEQKNKIADNLNEEIINNTYEKIVNTINDDSNNNKNQIINLYNILTSNNFRLILTFLIAVNVIIISIIKKSLYKWSFNLGISLLINAIIFTILIPIITINIGNYLSQKTAYSLAINTQTLNTWNIACFIVSIVLLTLYIIIKNIENKNRSKIRAK